jgi:hypothetical protein
MNPRVKEFIKQLKNTNFGNSDVPVVATSAIQLLECNDITFKDKMVALKTIRMVANDVFDQIDTQVYGDNVAYMVEKVKAELPAVN